MAEQNTIHVDMDTTVIFQEKKRLLFFGLPWTFTKYTITPSLLTIDRGFLNTIQDDSVRMLIVGCGFDLAFFPAPGCNIIGRPGPITELCI